MAAKARKRKVKKAKTNGVWIFVSIIIAIAVISMLLSYFWINEEKPNVLLLPVQEQPQQNEKPSSSVMASAIKNLEGTWVSNYDGAMLTISGLKFSLELSGVDAAEKIEGKLAVEENIVTLVYTSGTEVCKGPEGHYLYSIDENGELFFKLIKDICDGRKERMTASWFSL